MKQKWIDAYMDTAERFAQLSSAVRLKVGAVIVKDHRIVSIGYNGTPMGWDNECEYKHYSLVKYDYLDEDGSSYELKTKPEVMHAERNALDKLARTTGGGEGSSMFITHAPCIECAKSIFTAGITNVYYRHQYRNNDGVSFLEKCGVSVHKS